MLLSGPVIVSNCFVAPWAARAAVGLALPLGQTLCAVGLVGGQGGIHSTRASARPQNRAANWALIRRGARRSWRRVAPASLLLLLILVERSILAASSSANPMTAAGLGFVVAARPVALVVVALAVSVQAPRSGALLTWTGDPSPLLPDGLRDAARRRDHQGPGLYVGDGSRLDDDASRWRSSREVSLSGCCGCGCGDLLRLPSCVWLGKSRRCNGDLRFFLSSLDLCFDLSFFFFSLLFGGQRRRLRWLPALVAVTRRNQNLGRSVRLGIGFIGP